jgi:hypothetical protein
MIDLGFHAEYRQMLLGYNAAFTPYAPRGRPARDGLKSPEFSFEIQSKPRHYARSLGLKSERDAVELRLFQAGNTGLEKFSPGFWILK